jgi:hypothetical protein
MHTLFEWHRPRTVRSSRDQCIRGRTWLTHSIYTMNPLLLSLACSNFVPFEHVHQTVRRNLHERTHPCFVPCTIGTNQDLTNRPEPGIRLADLTNVHSNVHALRKFNYSGYPPHFDVAKHGGRWAWKPVLIKSVRESICLFVCLFVY